MAASETSAQSKNSLAGMELLAEEQALAIRRLEMKIESAEEEIEKLIEKQRIQEQELSTMEESAIRRFIVSDARLAHTTMVLPSKRRRRSSDLDIEYDVNDDGFVGDEVEMNSRERVRQTYVLNPAIDFIYQKAYEAAQAGKMRLQQSYDDLIAWKFSPDSASGKRLMACMRKLLDQNRHLGAINQMDRLVTLESETQMQASCIREYMKTAQELKAVLQESSTDLDGVQSSLFTLKKQLNKAETLIKVLKDEYEKVNPGQSDALIAAALATLSQQSMGAAGNDAGEGGEEMEGKSENVSKDSSVEAQVDTGVNS